MGTKRKHKSKDDDKMQADSLKKGDLGSWTSENGNERQTARPTRARVSDFAPDLGSSLPPLPPADPLVTLPDRRCKGDPAYELNYVFDRGAT